MVASALLLLIGLPWLIWCGPYVIDADHLNEDELKKGSAALVTGLRTAVVALTAALGAGIALLYTARTYRLTLRGQITDRFTKALERLGSDEIYVRIGGILALEQIVQDAPERAATDAARVLSHFIRDRAPIARQDPATGSPDPNSDPRYTVLPDEPAADVQAALTALTQTASRIHVAPDEKLDLHGLHLAGAHLVGADLSYADLQDTTLTKASLGGATLTKASLHRAWLVDADLHNARMEEAILHEATLSRAKLDNAQLTDAELRRATLVGASLRGATLTGDVLDGAKLMRAVMRGVTLTGAQLWRADLSDAVSLTPRQACSANTNETTQMPARLYPRVDSSAPSPP